MENRYFENVKRNFGFGCMRLPMVEGEVDLAETCRMVDAFLENGFNYFDTAHGYLDGKSEVTLEKCLTSRYLREAYILTNKLSTHHFTKEVVQIQLNYVDFDDPSVQSRKCLEVCRKHGKPAIIMEPVKGGSLVKLPEEAQKVFDALGGGSNASYAIRFAASQEGVAMVLSGMGDMEMMEDNISFMKDFQPLTEAESAAVEKVCGIFRSLGTIPCTACRYCTEVCPKGIAIPELFACMNAKKLFNNWNSGYYYNQIHTKSGGKASDCLKCGKCEKICPQHLKIRELLEEVAKEFEE